MQIFDHKSVKNMSIHNSPHFPATETYNQLTKKLLLGKRIYQTTLDNFFYSHISVIAFLTLCNI
jgi:hypothetical protein